MSAERMHWSTIEGMPEILRGVAAVLSGDREGGQALLVTLWEKWSQDVHYVQRCVIAHYLADAQDDVAAELAWDRKALQAATGFDDGEDHDPIDPTLAELMPSLLLNVGDALRRLGQGEAAKRYARLSLARVGVLADDSYGRTVRTAIERLLARV